MAKNQANGNANVTTEKPNDLIQYSAAAKEFNVSVSTIANAVNKPRFADLFAGKTDVYTDPFGRPPIRLVSRAAVADWIKARETEPTKDGRGNRRGGMRFYKVRIPDSRYQEYVDLLSANGFEAPIAAFTQSKGKRVKPQTQEIAVEQVDGALPVGSDAPPVDVELVEA